MNGRRLIFWAGFVVVMTRAVAAEAPPPEILTLAEARSRALIHHPRVRMAELTARIAEESAVVARAAYLPSAEAYADAVAAGNANTRILAGGLNNPAIYDRTADGIAVTQLITDFGRTSNRMASARLAAKAEAANAEATREQLLLNVDVAYERALEAAAVLKVARATVGAQDTLARQIEALAGQRLRSDLDVSFAQVGLEQSRLILLSAEGEARGSQAALASALGERRVRGFQLAEPATPPPLAGDAEAAIDAALRNRPDLQRLRFQRDAAERAARSEKDRNYPVISAVGTMGNALSHDDRLPNKYAAGAITLDFPIFSGGADLARGKAADLQAQVAAQALREAEDNVSRDVSLAWVAYDTARQRLRTTALLAMHARDAAALASARYRVGSSSIVELTQAQLNATSAQIGEATARYEAMIQAAWLDYQLGRI